MFSAAVCPKGQGVRSGDPLGGFSFNWRFQTLRGFGLTPRTPIGLYKDASLTDPATSEGDHVNGVASVVGGAGTMVQGDFNANSQILHFDSGIPTINFSGTGFFELPDASLLSEAEMFVLFKNANAGDGSTIYCISGTSPDDANSYLPLSGTGNGILYDSFGTNTRRNGITGTFTAGYNVYNVSSKYGEWRCAINGVETFSTSSNTFSMTSSPAFGTSNTGGRWSGGNLIAILLSPLVLTPAQRTIINSYLSSLPPNL